MNRWALGVALAVGACHRTAGPPPSAGDVEAAAAPATTPPRPTPTPPPAAAATSCAPAISDAERASRAAWLRDDLEKWVARFEERAGAVGGALRCPLDERASKGAVHDWGDYALTKLVLAKPDDAAAQSLVDSGLRCLWTFQRQGDARSAEHGVFPFHYGDPANPKDNPTEFALAPLAGLLALRPPSAAARAELEPHLVASLDAVERHPVCPRYTNICLLQTAEMLALGHALAASADPATRAFGAARVASGLARLDEWLAFTRDAGIAEFDSPTYTAVDLMALLLALRAAPDDASRSSVRAALEFVWSDAAANFFAGRGSLGGPHSRTYDFFAGQGPMSLPYYLEGLRQAPPPPADLGPGILADTVAWLNAAENLYRPSDVARCLAAAPEREVVSTFGPHAGLGGRQRYAYLTPEFAIGGASADYGTNVESDQDELLRAELASSPRTSAIAVLPDYLDSPGVPLKSGNFTKNTHLLMSPAVAQSQGTMLALLRVDAADPKYTGADGKALRVVNLATNIVVPADADEILVDGSAAQRDRDTPLGSRPTIVVRIGTAAVAISVLDASGIECPGPDGTLLERHKAALHFEPLDAAGGAHGPVARLAIYHDVDLPSDTSSLAHCFARAALLFVAERCSGEHCAADLSVKLSGASRTAKASFDSRTGDWDVRAHVPGSPELRVRRTVCGEIRDDRLLAREVGGKEMAFAPLRVNGVDVEMGR